MQQAQGPRQTGPFLLFRTLFRMGEGVKRRAAGRVGRQVFIPRVGCGIKTGSTGVLAGLPGPQKQKGATVRQGMSSQEARVSLFGDLTRVSFYGERQGLFFRGTQQPGGGRTTSRPAARGERRCHQARLIGIPPGFHPAAGLNVPTRDAKGLCFVRASP